MSAPFDEAEAAARLGIPGERFESITAPYVLDDVCWVIFGAGDRKTGRPVIVEDGHVVSGQGYAVGMAWLRRLAARQASEVGTSVVPQVLQWYDALPLGWNSGHAFDPQTNERGHVTLHPIEVKLVSSTPLPARSRTVRPRRPGEPPEAPPAPPPPGGVTKYQRPCRATLREVAGRLTWIVEEFDPYARTWGERLREAAEP
jgi:hypothetical protein